ncbi:MAG: hypothetical protein QMB98_05155 [Flaviflexus sp.]
MIGIEAINTQLFKADANNVVDVQFKYVKKQQWGGRPMPAATEVLTLRSS